MTPVPSSLPVIQPEALAACCSPMTAGVVTEETAETLARMFKALGDPTRVKLLSMIAAAPDGEACICDMTEPVGLSQPTVSHHMRLLVEAGLAAREQRGRWAYYRVAPEALSSLAGALAPADPSRS
jgi:ArsR family transcriptional regulator, arsenate/arsenite/antimonite-responsive transcriptional repressor